jgi:methionine synthase I (cobalamin-dependent)
LRWSIDAGDAYSVAKVRRAVVEQLRTITDEGADLFTVETVLGELLLAEMERGHVALAVLIERGLGGPTVDVYTQGTTDGESTRGELRDAILSGARLPMSIEVTAQGTHYCLRVPRAQDSPFAPPV